MAVKVVKIGEAYFAKNFFVASCLILASGFCCLISFASPYWSQSYPSTHNEFKNIGLWEACFYRYRHWKDDNQKPYTGCFWFWSPDMIRFRDWLMPPWFIAVQFFACFGFIFLFVTLALLSVSFMTSLRFKFFFLASIFSLSVLSDIMIFLALLIYGVNGDNREWMPRPEFNVYSWGYWFELSACFFLFTGLFYLGSELKSVYQVRHKNRKLKFQFTGDVPMDSHLQINTSSMQDGINHY